MQETDPNYVPSLDHSEAAEADTAPSLSTHALRRLLYLAFVILAVMLLILLPPYISVNRYQRRIATSIGDSLGRPVHLDKVSLNLLPLPGFTLENFVVDEDPAFGSEPVIRANSVRATLRLSSLWSRRVEFSTISFTEPSVNLVHTAVGKWNLESILLHAAHISAAPTAQRKAGPAPRFPYIEATGARLNLKLDREKSPISLTEADFALWLPDPQQWHLRLSARPARTDTDVSDTGTLELEGTLGRAASLDQVPISLRAEWRNAPLGGASRLLLGRDAGIRGEMVLTANAQGTVSNSNVQARLRLTDTRRADFVPAQPMDIDLQCLGSATADFHSFQDLRCSWPPAGSSDAPIVALTGSLPDLRNPKSADLQIGTPGLPAATLLEWLRVASARVPADISAAGALTGNLSYAPASPGTLPWRGELLLTNTSLINPHAGPTSLVSGDVALRSTTTPAPKTPQTKHHKPTPPTADGFQLEPVSLALGGKDPATLEGHLDAAGCTFHLTGMASTARLMALATALPQLGDGLAEVLPTNRAAGPYRIDLTATRPWGQPQIWTDTSPRPPALHPHR
ncbi:AsmA family protein [Tunturiibacter gelidoferens]|uniref:AsmA protein n=1 Tax=Tunturiibacter gelidiferens TaxID=3069689 RepID=A0ACC5NZD5_9BACT|nr:AsmA family protein [Edaphobacter lichenicola]MBB5339945.1 AsmA protein [Edaphobacter lichenicola]